MIVKKGRETVMGVLLGLVSDLLHDSQTDRIAMQMSDLFDKRPVNKRWEGLKSMILSYTFTQKLDNSDSGDSVQQGPR